MDSIGLWLFQDVRKPADRLVELLWWAVAGSNRGPPACKAGALTN
jgi:hypothetical protein